jgi:hypothetical protein
VTGRAPCPGLQDADRVKALYRRGLARMAKEDLDRADEDLKAALKLDARGPDVRRAIETLRGLQRADRERQRALWAGKLAAAAPAEDEGDEGEGAPAAGAAGGRPPQPPPGGGGSGGEKDARAMTRAELEKMLRDLESPPGGGGGGGKGWLGGLGRWFGWS